MIESDLDNSEQSFIAEGLGNGWLHPTVVRNVDTYWKGGHTDDDFFVGFEFTHIDWEALFFGVLKCPEWGEMQDGEDYSAYRLREYERFQICTSRFPMLGRIFDMYEDAGYTSDEVGQLREQCLKLQSATVHE